MSLLQLPPSLRLPSYTFLLLHFPPSLSLRSHLSFCPAQIFNFYSGVSSFRSVVVFLLSSSLFVWFFFFQFAVLALVTGRRGIESGFFALEMAPGNIGCIGDQELKTLQRPKEPEVDIPVWLRKAMVAWTHTPWWDLP